MTYKGKMQLVFTTTHFIITSTVLKSSFWYIYFSLYGLYFIIKYS